MKTSKRLIEKLRRLCLDKNIDFARLFCFPDLEIDLCVNVYVTLPSSTVITSARRRKSLLKQMIHAKMEEILAKMPDGFKHAKNNPDSFEVFYLKVRVRDLPQLVSTDALFWFSVRSKLPEEVIVKKEKTNDSGKTFYSVYADVLIWSEGEEQCTSEEVVFHVKAFDARYAFDFFFFKEFVADPLITFCFSTAKEWYRFPVVKKIVFEPRLDPRKHEEYFSLVSRMSNLKKMDVPEDVKEQMVLYRGFIPSIGLYGQYDIVYKWRNKQKTDVCNTLELVQSSFYKKCFADKLLF